MIRSALLRARLVVRRHGTVLVVALALVGIVALGGAGWLYTHPPTTEVTDHTHRQTVRSNVSTQAVVAENATLYEPGRSLKNKPVYLRSVTPSTTLVQTTTVPENRRVAVSQRIVLTYRAEHDDETFWRNSTVIERTETTTRSGRVRTSTRIDPAAIRTRVRALERTVDDAGSVHVGLRSVVSYSTPRYNGTLAEPFELRISDEWYRIGSPSASRTHSMRDTRTVAVPSRQRAAYTGLGVFGAGSLLLGIAVGVVARIDPRREETAELEYQLYRLRHAEWISTGTLPDDAGETTVSVASLEALVDVGIDTNNRVIHDPSCGWYAVIDGSTVYCYDRSRARPSSS